MVLIVNRLSVYTPTAQGLGWLHAHIWPTPHLGSQCGLKTNGGPTFRRTRVQHDSLVRGFIPFSDSRIPTLQQRSPTRKNADLECQSSAISPSFLVSFVLCKYTHILFNTIKLYSMQHCKRRVSGRDIQYTYSVRDNWHELNSTHVLFWQ